MMKGETDMLLGSMESTQGGTTIYWGPSQKQHELDEIFISYR